MTRQLPRIGAVKPGRRAGLPPRTPCDPFSEGLPAGEVFGPSRAAAEVNRRFGRHLSRPADPRLASSALRHLRARGVLRVVKKGSAHQEALYAKV